MWPPKGTFLCDTYDVQLIKIGLVVQAVHDPKNKV